MLFPSYQEAAKHVSQVVIDHYLQSSSEKNDNESVAVAVAVKKCGDLTCQHDSYQKFLGTGMILSAAAFCQQKQQQPEGGGGKKNKKQQQKQKKGKKSSSSPEDSTATTTTTTSSATSSNIVVALSDSILFPEGGGQPSDHGTISIIGTTTTIPDFLSSLQLQVINVQNVQNVCVATCRLLPSSSSQQQQQKGEEGEGAKKEDDGTTTTTTTDMLLEYLSTTQNPTSTPIPIYQTLDWERRYDIMTQHSAQHLISAVAMNLFDINTHSFSLQEGEADPSYIDFTIPQDNKLDEYKEKFQAIEDTSNQHIRQNLPMKPTWLEVNDPLFQSKVRSRLLPKGLTGKIRLVEIGGNGVDSGDASTTSVDCNTCCGTHVPTLGELQMIQFYKIEKFKNTVLRVYYAAAQRLLKIGKQNYQRQQDIMKILACPLTEITTRLDTLLTDKKTTQNKISSLQQTIMSEYIAKEIVVEFTTQQRKEQELLLQDTTNNNNALVVIRVLDSETISGADLTGLSNTVWEQLLSETGGNKDNDGERKSPSSLLLLVSGTAFLLTTGNDMELVDQIGKTVAEKLNGRGGGRKGKFQGKMQDIPTKESIQAVKEFLLKGSNKE